MFDIRSYVSDRPGKTEVGSVRIPYFFKNTKERYRRDMDLFQSRISAVTKQMSELDIPDNLYNGLSESFDEIESIIINDKKYVIEKTYDFRTTGYELIDDYHADEIPEYKSELDIDIDKLIGEVEGWNTEFEKPAHSKTFI